MICIIGLLEGRQAKLRNQDVLDPTPFLIYVRHRRELLRRQHDDYWGHLMGELGVSASSKSFERSLRRWETDQPLVLLSTIEDFLSGPAAPMFWELYPEASLELEERGEREEPAPRTFLCEICGTEVVFDGTRPKALYCGAKCRDVGCKQKDRARKRRRQVAVLRG